MQFSRFIYTDLEAEGHDEAKTRNSRSLESFQASSLGAYEDLSNSNSHHFRNYDSNVVAGVEWTVPDPFPPNRYLSDPDLIAAFVEASPLGLATVFGDVIGDTHEVEIIATPELVSFEPGALDDHEVGVPLDKVADCLDSFLDLAEDLSAERFLRNFIAVRFGPKETGLLSGANDGAVVWFEISDTVYYNREYVIGLGTYSLQHFFAL